MTNTLCPQCGSPLERADVPCPVCLLRLAATQTGNESDGNSVQGLDIETDFVQNAFPELEIVEKIGRGGMGTVYKARQPKLDRFVALKILSENLAAKPAFAERFAREGKILARLNHPNIVSVYDFGQIEVGDTSLFYLILEYVDGVNLRQAMREEKFTPEQAIAIVPKICEALQFAHDEGVLHRDIKPENILLDVKGRVKIADFGIASFHHTEQHESHLTQTGQILGTPDYMAPEQHDAPATVDHRADIYSLGVVFYELLTGELPRGSFPPPSERTPVNAEIDSIVLKALKKNREQRQQTALELKTEIETSTQEKKKMTQNEEHLNNAAEQPRQPENKQESYAKWNECGSVKTGGSDSNIWKMLFFILLGTVLVVAGFIFFPAGLEMMSNYRQFQSVGVFGLLFKLAFIIGGVTLMVYFLTKNNRTALPTIPPMNQTTWFCTHCGGKLAGNVYACPHCGFAPLNKRNFCFHCGVATHPEQVMCVVCGFPLQVPLQYQVQGFLNARKDKVAVGMLAIFLGWLGIHKFYLGSWGWGIFYLLFSWTGVPFILGIVEGIIFLLMDNIAFEVRYNQTLASPFRW